MKTILSTVLQVLLVLSILIGSACFVYYSSRARSAEGTEVVEQHPFYVDVDRYCKHDIGLDRAEQIELMKECVSDGLECAKFKSHPPEIMMLTRLFWEYRTRGYR